MTARRAFSSCPAQTPRPPRLAADIDLAQVSDLQLEQAGKSMRRFLESWSNGASGNAILMGAITAFWFLIAAEQRRRRRRQLQNCRFKFANHSQHR